MSNIYLLNLGFSFDALSLQTGSFAPPPASVPNSNYFATSQLWLKHKTNVPTPTWATVPGVNGVAVPLSEQDWDTPVLSKSGALNAAPGDVVAVRFFSSGALTRPPSAIGAAMRCSIVFGRGRTGSQSLFPGNRQSPLQQVNAPAMPRSVVDTDTARNYADWPYRADNDPWVWIWCLGSLQEDPNVDPHDSAHYTFNIGATYVPYISGAFGAPYLFGHDPGVVVKGGGPHKP